MKQYQNYVCAIIENEHIIRLTLYDVDPSEVSIKGNQSVVDCTRIPCHIGDIYREGNFYHVDGEKEVLISPLPDYSILIEKIQNDNQVLINALADTLGGAEL